MSLAQDVTKYIDQANTSQTEIMEVLRKLIHATIPDLDEAIKWGFPVFSHEEDLIYFRSNKQHVTLGFLHFERLTAFADVLQGTGKSMRHLKIRSVEQIDEKLVVSILKKL